MARPTIVLGTTNRKKAEELVALLAPLGIKLETLADHPAALAVEETGSSFAANAQLKAVAQARHLGRWILGEDSGLVVPSLDGAPGIYSARFAGAEASDEENNQKLLAEMAAMPAEKRDAYYVCHMALADPQGMLRAESEAQCHGRIAAGPRGTGGFGYDPLFEIREYHRTFGELGAAVKEVLSHRARAATLLTAQLAELIAAGELSAG